SIQVLCCWLSYYDSEKHKWITPAKSTLRGWVEKLKTQGFISKNIVDNRMIIKVIGFQKFCYPREMEEVCVQDPSHTLRTPFAHSKTVNLDELKKDPSLHYKEPITKPKTLKKNKQKETLASTDYKPNKDLINWALKEGINEDQLLKYADTMIHWSIGGGKKRVNWDSVLRNWVRREEEKKKTQPQKTNVHDHNTEFEQKLFGST
ncbi:hypothetical protein KAR91_30855, partial [Candidatus Pacearchaeota archaeon]|nr:hypothetical protein [Candidatus Pacearchaeota archaeon]